MYLYIPIQITANNKIEKSPSAFLEKYNVCIYMCVSLIASPFFLPFFLPPHPKSHCSSGCPGIHSVHQIGLELTEIRLGIKAYATPSRSLWKYR